MTRLRRIKRNESFAIIAHDSPSLREALPGPSGQPSPSIEGESPHARKDIRSDDRRRDPPVVPDATAVVALAEFPLISSTVLPDAEELVRVLANVAAEISPRY